MLQKCFYCRVNQGFSYIKYDSFFDPQTHISECGSTLYVGMAPALDDFIPDEAERHVTAEKGMKTNSRGRHIG